MSKDSPFAALAKLKASLPDGPAEAREEKEAAPPEASPLAGKIVVSKSRKGRGGKTVTLVTGLSGSSDARRELARQLGKALGCGASVEDDAIVVQGEQTARIKHVLESKGAKRVIVGT